MWGGYAEAMRGKLNVPLARLIPARLSAQREPISPEAWDEFRRQLGLQLGGLMTLMRATFLGL